MYTWYNSKNVLSVQLLGIPLLGVGTVLCLERDAWSMAKGLNHATNEPPPPFHLASLGAGHGAV